MLFKDISKRLNEKKGNVWVAVSIIVAGLLVAGAVIFTSGDNDLDSNQPDPTNTDEQQSADASTISPVTEEDHMIGDINAPIKIVEYSDIECPYCARLHGTLHQVTEEFPNEVTWVYRHLPIIQSHSKALNQAIATECAAEQGGNDAFWAYIDQVYEETPGGNRFNLDRLPEIAAEQSLNVDEFNQCLDSGRYNDKIQAQIDEGFAAGAEGTPFSVVITPEGNHIPVSGAQPLNAWQQIISQIIESEL